MREITREEVVARIREMKRRNLHVDSRLERFVDNANLLLSLILEDETSFESLIWHEIQESRFLTPTPKDPRSLKDVARRMTDRGFTFQDFVDKRVPSNPSYDPNWFRPCVSIDNNFDWNKFGWISLRLPVECERYQTPHGSLYILDGMHKTLVLARCLLLKQIEYRPVEGILIIPVP